MSKVRAYKQHRRTTPTPPADIDNLVDPGSEFEDLTLTQLHLSDQRREVAQATRWLDDDHRQLLSLWWLAEAGHVSRADLVDALELDTHHVTVRVTRMKAQLDTARLVVRALAARPGCAGLTDTAAGWGGQPAPVWRKRLARHIRTCPYCPGGTSDLVPAERLLAGVALTPLPAGLASHVLQQTATVTAASQGVALAGAPAETAEFLQQAGVTALSLPKILVAIAATVAVLGGGGLIRAGFTAKPSGQPAGAADGPLLPTITASVPATAESAPATPSPTASEATPATSRSRAAPTKSPTPVKSPAGKSAATVADVSAAEQRLLVLLNERRRALGLSEVKLGMPQQRAAEACVKRNLALNQLRHCGYEVLYASGGYSSPEAILAAWFKSTPHKNALTHPRSHFAGPAIVYNGNRLVAAINIDY